MAAGDVIRSDGVMPPGALLSALARKKKWCFETSSKSRKSWDGWKMTWECIPNIWCDRGKRSRGCHGGFMQRNTYWQRWRWSERSHIRIAWNERSKVGGLLKLQHPVSNGSYLETYSVTNRKPVQLRQNRRDMIEARCLGHNACKYSEQAGGGPGWKQMWKQGENCNSQVVIQL